MNNINRKDPELGKVLGYGIVEAPMELEFLVKKRIAEEAVQPSRSYMGIVVGWFPVIISIVGLIFGVITSIFLFFPQLGSALEVVNKVLSFILSPTVMMIALSVITLILVDSLLEKRIKRLAV
jgi:choline-glycine betaine transporter